MFVRENNFSVRKNERKRRIVREQNKYDGILYDIFVSTLPTTQKHTWKKPKRKNKPPTAYPPDNSITIENEYVDLVQKFRLWV